MSAWYGHGEHATDEDLAPDRREAERDEQQARHEHIDDWHLQEPPDPEDHHG